jgi:hypothetical protein
VAEILKTSPVCYFEFDGETIIPTSNEGILVPDKYARYTTTGHRLLNSCVKYFFKKEKNTEVNRGTNVNGVAKKNNNLIVAVGKNIYVSNDLGYNWSYVMAVPGTDAQMNAIDYGGSDGNYFLAVGTGGQIGKSEDGTSWSFSQAKVGGNNITDNITSICYAGNGRFNFMWIAGTENGRILTSYNGVDWTQRYYRNNTRFHGVAFRNDICVAISGYSDSMAIWSTDGINWTVTNFPISQKCSITTGLGVGNSNVFVAVGASGMIAISYDGKTWTLQSSPITSTLNSVAYLNRTFVAVGNYGIILVSKNAINWVISSANLNETLNVVASLDNKYVVFQANIMDTLTYIYYSFSLGKFIPNINRFYFQTNSLNFTT